MEKKNKFKEWYVKNKRVIKLVGWTVAGAAVSILIYKGLSNAIAKREADFLKMVDNNLKFKEDGEVFKVVIDIEADEFNRTITSKKFTKLNGERLYLGLVEETIELSEEEKLQKQLDKLGRTMKSAINTIIKK